MSDMIEDEIDIAVPTVANQNNFEDSFSTNHRPGSELNRPGSTIELVSDNLLEEAEVDQPPVPTAEDATRSMTLRAIRVLGESASSGSSTPSGASPSGSRTSSPRATARRGRGRGRGGARGAIRQNGLLNGKKNGDSNNLTSAKNTPVKTRKKSLGMCFCPIFPPHS